MNSYNTNKEKIIEQEEKSIKRGQKRRTIFFTTTFLITSIATLIMADLLWRIGFNIAKVVFFSIIFHPFLANCIWCPSWNFWVVFGPERKDFDHITKTTEGDNKRIPLAPTAIAIPVYNEDVTRVFEGIKTIYKSLEKTGSLNSFDFFILSDTTNASQAIQEESSWIELCQQLNALGRIYYRRRKNNFNRKAGNIADFCKSWGENYRYMVCLDADSIVSGECIQKLVRIMQRNPKIGICQTAPILIKGESLFARVMQFASNFYGPLFQAGLNFWQQGGGNFWGHNAIIRVKPFMEHCGLPRLPGKEPFGGKILSHDFVEASLMRKGGWFVWLAYDIPGSYEEGPPDIIETAKRDRRWCQGNLQHTWLVLSKGTPGVNRIHMLNGIMSYLASFLWFLFLVIASFLVYEQHISGLTVITVKSFTYFTNISVRQEGLILLIITLLILLIPKICSVIRVFLIPKASTVFGGHFKILISVILEIILSALIAPILMIFHSQFIIYTFIGKGVSWGPQKRSAKDGIELLNAIRTLGPHTIIGLIWAGFAYWSSIAFFWWLSPIFISLLLSIPVSIFMSKISIGNLFQKIGLFLTPSETNPSEELVFLEKSLRHPSFSFPTIKTNDKHPGILRLIVDPYINAIHITLLSEDQKENNIIETDRVHKLGEKLLANGPEALTTNEIKEIINVPEKLHWLHEQVWLRPSDQLHKTWIDTIYSYS